MAPHEGQEISWSVSTHVHKERSVDWYWALGVIALVGAGLSFWLGNMLFALILVVGLGSLGVLLARGPREHRVAVDSRGVTVDGTLYPNRSLKAFWVDRREDDPRLYLITSGLIAPHITLPLESVAQGEQVRSILRRNVKEEEQEPHFGEHLAELFGL
jgi:hypothetical protein